MWIDGISSDPLKESQFRFFSFLLGSEEIPSIHTSLISFVTPGRSQETKELKRKEKEKVSYICFCFLNFSSFPCFLILSLFFFGLPVVTKEIDRCTLKGTSVFGGFSFSFLSAFFLLSLTSCYVLLVSFHFFSVPFTSVLFHITLFCLEKYLVPEPNVSTLENVSKKIGE